MSARDHTEDTGYKGKFGHIGFDGSCPQERMLRYAYSFNSGNAENLSYQSAGGGLEVILSLFVDDGLKDRGHRKNMQNPLLTYMGCFSGSHKSKYGGIQTINYAGPF